MPQSLTEAGYIIQPDGSHEIWRPSGVNEINGIMQISGPLFHGKRLDTLISSQEDPQAALEAVAIWLRAKMFLGDKHSTLNPGAVFISPAGAVFFAPEQLSNRCLYSEQGSYDRYNCPDLTDMEAVAFCAGVMLYMILAKTHPYPAADIYQDMREGVFMPVHLAVPNLEKKLSALIQSALLLPVSKEASAGKIIKDLLAMLMDKKTMFRTLTEEENAQIIKEKDHYLQMRTKFVKTTRYVKHNKLFLGGIALVLLFVVFFAGSMIRGRLERPTTKGLTPAAVVAAYYQAFNSLDHVFMEACLMGANKSDVTAALNIFVIDRVRQAYEPGTSSALISAEAWIQQGGELPAENIFGVTDLNINLIGGSEAEGQIHYRADYLFFIPHDSASVNRSDELVLRRDRRNNWRITEIIRTER